MSAVAPPYLQPVLPPAKPKPIQLSLRRLRSLPYRLTHPPSAPKRRLSWGLTPRFEIALADILDRKHLPPLGLKDFEEWLLFVEEAPENLYFILWLREYSTRYAAWTQHSRAAADARSRTLRAPSPRSQYRSPPPTPGPNAALALFYLRAKRTFLTPNAPYELDVPSDVLAPFHCPPLQPQVPVSDNDSECIHDSWSATTCAYPDAYGYGLDGGSLKPSPPPPDPAVFAELAERAQAELRAALQRFVRATFRNVGSPRAICGCIGGACIGVGTSAPILIANFVTGGDRWWRLVALPGLWLGLTIFISAMYGVCMMIYVFGDLRQLRSFELERPQISSPRPIASPVLTPALTPLASPASATPLSPNAGTTPFPTVPSAAWRRFSRTKSATPMISPPVRGSLITSASVPGLTPLTRPPITPCPPSAALTRPSAPRLRIVPPGSAAEVPSPLRWSRHMDDTNVSASRHSIASTLDSDMDNEDSDSECEAVHPVRSGRIQISDAFFDAHPAPEGPATAPCPPLWPDYMASDEEESRATAAFIHPFDDTDSSSDDGAAGVVSKVGAGGEAEKAGARQRVDPFDFDALPPRRPRFASPHRPHSSPPPAYRRAEKGTRPPAGAPPYRPGVRGLLGRVQTRCSPRNAAGALVQKVQVLAEKEKAMVEEHVDADVDLEKGPTLEMPTAATAGAAPNWHERLRRVSDVPAFAVPLTPVLSAVVARAQWEVVVRSALMAALVSCAVIGGLLGVPVVR